jgi:phage terminase small subunit
MNAMVDAQTARDLGVVEISFPDLYRTYVAALRKCNLRERAFIKAIAERYGNPYEAAEEIGMPKFMADRLLARENVQAAWRALDAIIVHRLGITTSRILTELTRIATSDISRMFDDDGAFKSFDEMGPDQSAAIESVEVQELFYGQGEDRRQIGVTKKIRLHKKQPALLALARMRGMLVDQSSRRLGEAAQAPAPSEGRGQPAIDVDKLNDEQLRVIASIPVDNS